VTVDSQILAVKAQLERVDAKVATLTAENERLRALLTKEVTHSIALIRQGEQHWPQLISAESGIATAVALLERARPHVPSVRWEKDLVAFLASAQPAAPTYQQQRAEEAACAASDALLARPAAPTRTEACDECGITHGPGNTNRLCPKASDYSPALVAKIEREWPTRTEAITAEQAARIQECSPLPRFEASAPENAQPDSELAADDCSHADGSPTRTEADPFYEVLAEAETAVAAARTEAELKLFEKCEKLAQLTARTEAEQAVLDAMAALPLSRAGDSVQTNDVALRNALEAELARRGLP
jgi:hypothetical protein